MNYLTTVQVKLLIRRGKSFKNLTSGDVGLILNTSVKACVHWYTGCTNTLSVEALFNIFCSH